MSVPLRCILARARRCTPATRWEEIAAVVDALEIPVLGNGDIKTPQDALRMWQQTKCAGVMIARGSFGQPWIFDQTRDLLEGRPMRPDPTVEERSRSRTHARMSNDYEPDRKAPPSNSESTSAGMRRDCRGPRSRRATARGHYARRSRRNFR